MDRRRLLSGVSAIALLRATGAHALIFKGGIGISSGGGSVLLATLTLVNTSGSTQSANFVSPIFGWVFKKGDIPTGTAAIFKIGGVAQPFSWGQQAYWSDGSLKFASFMLRSGTSIAGSGTLAVEVWSGGTAPSASVRTLTEVYNQLIQINAAAAPITNANITGTYNAVLASNANNLEQVVYMDGAAGKVWRVLTNFVKSGSAHGQMVAYHYIAALTDSSDNLGGFRYLPCVTQPYYDVNSPAKDWRALSTLNWQHGAGPTIVAFPFPFTSGTFTATNIGGSHPYFAASTSVLVNWNLGSDAGATVPGYFTTTGTLPGGAGLNTTDVFFSNTYGLSWSVPNGTFDFNPTSNGNSAGNWLIPTTAGTGVHTFNPCYCILQFCRHYGATVDGTWNFFQGTGSLSADSTVRTQLDKTYWVSTKAIPPFALSLIGSVTDNTSTQDWNMQAIGTEIPYFPQTGDRGDIGPFTAQSARHFYNQSALSDKVIRLLGLSNGDLAYCFRNSSNKQIPNLTTATYSGMTSANVYWPATFGTFTPPPANCGANVYFSGQTDHMPDLIGYPYLVFGEPQYLDQLLESGNGTLLTLVFRNVTNPVMLEGITTGFGGQQRELSWATRNINVAASYLPATMPDGSPAATYIRDRAAASNKHVVDIWNNTTMNSYCTSTGYWTFVNDAVNDSMVQSAWQRAYTISGICFGAANEDANALTALSSIFAAWYTHSLSSFGGWCIGSYYEVTGTGTLGDSNFEWPIITDDAHWAPYLAGSGLSWASGSNPTFTLSNGTPGYVLTNNDKYIFYGLGGAPGGMSLYTPYYAASVSGSTFKLRTAPSGGGSAVTTSNASTTFNIACAPAVPSTTTVLFEGSPIINQIVGVSRWGKAMLGTSVFDAIIADMNSRTALFTPAQIPQWAMQDTF